MPRPPRTADREGKVLGAPSPTAPLRKERALLHLLAFTQTLLDVDLDVLCGSGVVLGYLLKHYAQHLFETNHLPYSLVDAIQALTDRYPHCRSLMAPAWDMVHEWEGLEPTAVAPVIPDAIVKAASLCAWFGSGLFFWAASCWVLLLTVVLPVAADLPQ